MWQKCKSTAGVGKEGEQCLLFHLSVFSAEPCPEHIAGAWLTHCSLAKGLIDCLASSRKGGVERNMAEGSSVPCIKEVTAAS